MLLAQLGTAAEQLDDATILGRVTRGGFVLAEQSERLQRFHRPLRGGVWSAAKPVAAIDAVLQPLI